MPVGPNQGLTEGVSWDLHRGAHPRDLATDLYHRFLTLGDPRDLLATVGTQLPLKADSMAA